MVTIEFIKTVPIPGSRMRIWNVDRDGEPFGQIWTFKARGENHPFHVKTLKGHYSTFITLAGAKRHMELTAA